MTWCRAGLLALLGAAGGAWAEGLPMVIDPIYQNNAVVPRMTCEVKLDKPQSLTRGMVESRLRSGNVHAAYAEVLSLPAQVAEVAILRADILRRLDRPEARYWYAALQKTCVGGLAEHGLGLIAAGSGDYGKARDHLLRATQLMPTDARIRNDLGYVFIMLGQDAQAEFELRIASELAPEVRLPAFNLMLLALLRGDEAAWLAGRSQWQPDAAERVSLGQACQRIRARRLGLSEGAPADCPLVPKA